MTGLTNHVYGRILTAAAVDAATTVAQRLHLGCLQVALEALHLGEFGRGNQHRLGTFGANGEAAGDAIACTQGVVGALDILGEGQIACHQMLLPSLRAHGLGDERQRLATHCHGAAGLSRPDLELQRGNGELSCRLRGDLVGEAQPEEGLAIMLLGQLLCFATGRIHHRARQVQLRQDWRRGEPGVHQQVHLQANRTAHQHLVRGHQPGLHPYFGFGGQHPQGQAAQQQRQQAFHGVPSPACWRAASCSMNLRLRNCAGEVVRLFSQTWSEAAMALSCCTGLPPFDGVWSSTTLSAFSSGVPACCWLS
ncbi:hypothetical protein FQZ97_844960 [compost metagenome]